MSKITRRNFLLFSGVSSTSLFTHALGKRKAPVKPREISASQASCDPWIELKLDNMTWNLNLLRKLVKVPVMAVIKANAYGHGLVETGRHLEKAGIYYLMVGKLQEAFLLRKSGVSTPILNFGPFTRGDAEKIIQNNISQSVFLENVSVLSQAGLKLGKKARVHIHVDTGMGRMGISFRDAFPYIKSVSSLKGIVIKGISTTLTEADDFDREQISRFLSLCQKAERSGISLGFKHAASSDGVLDFPMSHLDMVRPGIALYGYYPSEKTQKEDKLGLKPALQFKSRVVDVKTLQSGDSASYHRKYMARKKEKIAIIPVGYSDGYPHNIIGKAFVLIKGKRLPLIAAITANHCAALLEKNSKVSPGDEVVLIGSQGKEKITADEVARWTEVSAYKILIGLNPLLPRKIYSS
jgi:alanine racemase